MVFVSVLLNCLKPPGKIVTSVLEIQSSTCHELWFVCRCTIEPVELSITFTSVLLKLIEEAGTYSLYWERERSSHVNVVLNTPTIGRGCHDLHLDIEDADVFLMRLSRWRVLDADVV